MILKKLSSKINYSTKKKMKKFFDMTNFQQYLGKY